MARRIAIVLMFGLAGCGSAHHERQAACLTTQPGGPRPPARALANFGAPMEPASDPRLYGNGVLWTSLPVSASSDAAGRQSGMLVLKVPWFRARPGAVTITGKPLFGLAARFRASVGTAQEYGRTGFAPSRLEFGRAGCWQIRAQLAGSVLAVVLYVRAA